MKYLTVVLSLLLTGCSFLGGSNNELSDDEILKEMQAGIDEHRSAWLTKDSIMDLISKKISSFDMDSLPDPNESVPMQMDFQSDIPLEALAANPDKNAYLVNYKLLQDSISELKFDTDYWIRWDDQDITDIRKWMTSGYSLEDDMPGEEDLVYKLAQIHYYLDQITTYCKADYLTVVRRKYCFSPVPPGDLDDDTFVTGLWLGNGFIFDFNNGELLSHFTVGAQNSDEIELGPYEIVGLQTLEKDLGQNVTYVVKDTLRHKYGAHFYEYDY